MQKNNNITVVKIGTAVLSGAGDKLNASIVKGFCYQISQLIKSGHKIVIVTSGAIGTGIRAAGLKHRPKKLARLQAIAAIGQSKLMKLYDEYMSKNGLSVAQILLTQEDFTDKKRYINARNTIRELLYVFNAVPVINENDTIATEEIKFGDNDRLSALVATLVGARQLIILTNVDGLHSPKDRKVIPLVAHITSKVQGMATEHVGKFATGGMRSKLQAIKMATASGINCVIANGKEKDVMVRIINGEALGTAFLAQ